MNNNTGFLLWQASLVWQKNVKKILNLNFQLTFSQYIILTGIHHFTITKKEVSQSVLAKYFHLERMTLSKNLQFLSEKKLISRKENKSDSRSKNIMLTKKGQAWALKIPSLLKKEELSFFNSFHKKDIYELNKYLSLIIDSKS